MSYHIVSIDAPNCSLSCRDGQLTCRTEAGEQKLPLEDTAAIIVTSFSVSIHSKLLLEAAKQGVGLIICENYTPASLVLPANRSTDTFLTKAQAYLPTQLRNRLWQKTVDAKCSNQLSLATLWSPDDPDLDRFTLLSNGRAKTKEAECAKLFWRIFSRQFPDQDGFRRGRYEGGLNHLLNYGYAVLLSTILQKLFAVGLDPTFGIFHKSRENATPLAYDIMEPFRPCVDWRVMEWTRQHPDPEEWQVSQAFRRWMTAFPLEEVDWLELTLEVRGVIEGVVRSFRQAVISRQSGLYQPWIRTTTKWAG